MPYQDIGPDGSMKNTDSFIKFQKMRFSLPNWDIITDFPFQPQQQNDLVSRNAEGNKKIGIDCNRLEEFQMELEETNPLLVKAMFETFTKYPREIRSVYLTIMEGVEGFEENNKGYPKSYPAYTIWPLHRVRDGHP